MRVVIIRVLASIDVVVDLCLRVFLEIELGGNRSGRQGQPEDHSSSLFPSTFTLVLLHYFRRLTGARGEIVVPVAVTGRAEIDGSGGSSCGKLLGVRRESRGELDGEICVVRFFRCSCAAFEAVEPCLSGAGLAWLL
ncbi:hypothetical protein Taro_055496 [Colocasia esculenta]|uniref:Uncharacterized protein n=1 Tax=Colocasia esculenta TaxID=4460 RepID=A0A843XRG2_COLES|nr:hypothetical protein [Colocasia esculenta]